MQSVKGDGTPGKEVNYPYEFDEEVRQKARVYHRISLFFSVFNTELLVNLLFFLLLIAGWSVALRAYAEGLSGNWIVSTAIYTAILLLMIWAVILLALLWFRSTLARLTRKPFSVGQLIASRLASLLRAEVMGIVLILLFYYLVRSFTYWWVIASVAISLYMLATLLLFSPKLLHRPDEETPHETPQEVRDRYSALLEASGIRGEKVSLSLFDFTTGASAFSVGIGRHKCIALSEKMISSLHRNELDVILAHELAHHANRDAHRKTVLEIALMAIVLFVIAQILPLFVDRFGITSIYDPANLPLILLLINVLAIFISPIFNQYSRKREFAADRYALSLTKDSTAFVSCQKRLADLELAPYENTAVEKLFFASHPSVKERISLAESISSEER